VGKFMNVIFPTLPWEIFRGTIKGVNLAHPVLKLRHSDHKPDIQTDRYSKSERFWSLRKKLALNNFSLAASNF
jgi:hypothetical protein